MSDATQDTPVPDIDALELAFGTTKSLPAWSDIPDEFKRMNGNLYVRAASGLFFKGGRLSDYGLRVKNGLDSDKVRRAIHAHLKTWAPKHEHKEAGVGLLLSAWCEPIEGQS